MIKRTNVQNPLPVGEIKRVKYYRNGFGINLYKLLAGLLIPNGIILIATTYEPKSKKHKGTAKSYLVAYRITKLLPFKADGSFVGEPEPGKKTKPFQITAYPNVKLLINDISNDIDIWNACVGMLDEFETRGYLKESVDEMLESIRECNLG